jgi:hypothetical protein
MITRAVFSYFNADDSFSNKAGYRFYSDFLYTMALATHRAMQHFKSVQIVTTSWGERVLRTAGIQATEFSTELDAMKSVSRWFWAYGKMIAYTMQTEPFVHVDNDVFIRQPLPDRVLNARLCFQSKEQMDVLEYNWYNVLRPCWGKAVIRPQVVVENEVTDFAYNCGICGGHDLEFFKEWRKISTEYIFAPENQRVFFDDFRPVLMHQNLWHEQYFGVALIKAHQLRDQVELLTDDINDPAWKQSNLNNKTYTHLWGATKTDQHIMRQVRMGLKKFAPELYNKVTEFVNNYLFSECQNDVRVGATL